MCTDKKTEIKKHMLAHWRFWLILIPIGLVVMLIAVYSGVGITTSFLRDMNLTRSLSSDTPIKGKIIDTYIVCYDGKEYFVPYRGSVTPVYTDADTIRDCTIDSDEDDGD